MTSQSRAHRAVERQRRAVDHIRIRDLMQRRLNGNMCAVILIKQRELFFKVGPEKCRTGDGGAVTAGVGKARIGTGFWRCAGAAVPGYRERWINKKAL